MQTDRRVSFSAKHFWLTLFTLITLFLWLAIVLFVASHHEFRRDEVRAWSLAREARWPWELFPLIRNDGHPVVWYALLYLGLWVVNSPLVLPVVSVLIAFAAVVLFMRFAPFPLWFRCLFIFGGLPLYEYTVSARNYGISMLLMVIAAVLYPHRAKQGWWLAVVLALLANTNVHSALLVGVVAGVWATQVIRLRQPGAQFGLIIAAIALCALTTWPTENTILTSAHRATQPGDLALAFLQAVFRPDLTFKHLAPEQLSPVLAPILVAIFLVISAMGLLHHRQLFIAALAAQTLLGMLFLQVYSGSYRHEGLYLVFLLCLYWQAWRKHEKSGATSRWLGFGFYAGLVPLLTLNLILAVQFTQEDVQHDLSANRAFGALIQRTSAYSNAFGNAIIMAEPDYAIESLPYYIDNAIYLPREGRLGTTVSWTTVAADRMSLGQLLAAAQKIQQQENRPVLIALGHLEIDDAQKLSTGELRYSYNKFFTWHAEDWAVFEAATERMARFDEVVGDETYEVYALKR